MEATGEGEHAIDTAVAELYRGPLDAFVSRRETLAKELRGSRDRESASVVKALRKPSLAAWALNLVVLEAPDAMSALLGAIRDAVAAQSSGGSAGGAISGLRTAVREFAVEAGRAAQDAGHDVDINLLAGALFAVLGKTERFDDLRRGRLAEVPEAGGLDLLSLVPALPREPSPPAARPHRETPAARAPRDSGADRAAARARAEEAVRAAEVAEKALASAKARAEKALARLDDAEAGVSAAEAGLRKAEEEVNKARDHRDEAQQEAAGAAQAVERAEASAAEAGRQLKGE